MSNLVAKCRIEAGDLVILAGESVDKLDKKEIERLKAEGCIGGPEAEEPAAPLTEDSAQAQVKVTSKKVEAGE